VGDRKLSNGMTAAETADMMSSGKKPMYMRAGMSAEEFARGKAQNEAEKRRAADEVQDHQIVRR
jgi:hypothetical protein